MKLLYFSLLILVFGCSDVAVTEKSNNDQVLINYVNPFIGTGGHGHTFPGATMPFGMMQLSPDTRLDGWDGCSGYHYSDSLIYGFSHTHLSGTGVSDYGDVLIMPTNERNFNNGADGKKGYRAHFSHKNEIASPGYYKVLLDSTNIEVELTVSERSGIHKYQFPSSDNQFAIVDLIHRDKVLDAKIDRISDTEIQGFRFSDSWAKDQRLFFYIKTSHPFLDMLHSPSEFGKPGAQKIALNFINPKNEPVYIRIGISATDIEGAQNNMRVEISHLSFEEVKVNAEKSWEKQLHKIEVESSNEEYKTNFYSSLYHTMIAPNLYQDVDGSYRGMDNKVHKNEDFKYYTVFSLWDTYRATHPLFTIIEQDRTNDFINTFISKYQEGGIMPIWDLSANYTGCMIGYHAVPVIVDAYMKGIRNYNVDLAYEAMLHSATRDKLGLKSYKDYGFIPVEKESESVSKTLEYAYDDWCISLMSKETGRGRDFNWYTTRAQSYKNVFDPETKFMRGRFRNTWFSPFDPYEVNFNYTEANSWQYSFYVPQDISGLIKLFWGKDSLEKQLDKLFTAENKTSGRNQADITGLIGQYAHGNEPSHHMAYLYNFVNKPAKTQEKVYQILTTLYHNNPDGVSGNEDCGQMSAWYVLSSMGFYPVTPGSNQYIIGTPLMEKSTINLENGNTFVIIANNVSSENIYIKSAKLNGKEHSISYLNHEDIMGGGSLVFEMTNSPSSWGTRDEDIPITEITQHLIVPVPFISKGEVAFKGSTTIELKNADKETSIFYSFDAKNYSKYSSPFTVSEQVSLSVYSQKGTKKSRIVTTDFYKIDSSISISLKTEYANQYNGGGSNALIDGVLGTEDFRTGTWQGYFDSDLKAIIDLGKEKIISSVHIGFLQDQRSWIFYPTQVEFFVSKDGITYTYVGVKMLEASLKSEEVAVTRVGLSELLYSARYIKVAAKNLGMLPSWHLGYEHNGRSWLFADEIIIK